VRRIAVGFQDCQGLGADLQRFAPAIDVVIVVGDFKEGTGEEGKMPTPDTRFLRGQDRGPSGIVAIEPERFVRQHKVASKRRLAQ
jgi:hypothetical protein